MHVGSVARFTPPPDDEPFDYDAFCALVARRISLVPRYRQKIRWVPGPPRQPGLGRRRGLRHHLPRTAQRAAEAGQRRPAAAARRPAAGPPARPRPAAVGDLPRRGARRRPVRDHHQDPPRDGRRDQRGRHRHGAARCLADSARTRPTTAGCRDRSRVAAGLVLGALADTLAPADRRDRHRAVGHRRRAGRCRPRARGPRRDRRRSRVPRCAPRRTARSTPTIGEQRRFGMASTSLDDYKRIRKTHGGTVNDVVLASRRRGAADLAADPRRVGGAEYDGPRDGPGQRAQRGRGRRARQPGLVVLRRPAGRRAEPGHAAAPGQLRDEGPQGVGPVGRRRRAGATHRVRPTDDPLRGGAAGRGPDPAAVQCGRDQRARAAVPAVRRGRADGSTATRSCRWRRARRCRSV